MALIGGDIEAMGGLASTFNAQMAAIHNIISTIEGPVSSSTGFWFGPKGNELREAWPSSKSALLQLAEILDHCSTNTKTTADGFAQVGG